jgi:CMP-N,N'-diacetyllegionaminic acid synthase
MRLLGGKPLIAHTIEAAMRVDAFDRIVVSTDDPEIAEIALLWGAEVPFLRPAELAADITPAVDPVLHALQEMQEVTQVLLLQPTSPLRSSEDIRGIIALQGMHQCSSVVSVCVSGKHPRWMYSLGDSGEIKPVILGASSGFECRQQLEPVFVLNGALYLCDRAWLQNQRSFVGPGTLGYVMPPERSVDIDTPLDWLWAETLLQRAGELP